MLVEIVVLALSIYSWVYNILLENVIFVLAELGVDSNARTEFLATTYKPLPLEAHLSFDLPS